MTINIRFLSREWAVTVADAGGQVKVSAFNARFGVGIQEEIPAETWQETAECHREHLLRSLATLSLVNHANQLEVMVADKATTQKQLDARARNSK